MTSSFWIHVMNSKIWFTCWWQPLEKTDAKIWKLLSALKSGGPATPDILQNFPPRGPPSNVSVKYQGEPVWELSSEVKNMSFFYHPILFPWSKQMFLHDFESKLPQDVIFVDGTIPVMESCDTRHLWWGCVNLKRHRNTTSRGGRNTRPLHHTGQRMLTPQTGTTTSLILLLSGTGERQRSDTRGRCFTVKLIPITLCVCVGGGGTDEQMQISRGKKNRK